jgi:SAM-dependent methyltransferase
MQEPLRYIGGELELFSQARHWKHYFAQRLRPFISGDVLEVGAGIGGTTGALRNGKERSWTCLEPDPELAGRLAQRWDEERTDGIPAPRVVLGCLDALPDTPGFDTLLYVDVLEHIEHDAEQLQQAAARLRPRGHLVVLSPAHSWLFSPFDRAIGHYRRYTIATLRALTPQGTRLVHGAYLDCAGLLASWANRMLLRSELPTQRQVQVWDRLLVPCSRLLDRLTCYRLGKSVVAVWQRNGPCL